MPDTPDLPGTPPGFITALADRYKIERELGRGASAVVYLAHDVKYDRKVAVKVLHPELTHAVRAERFLREIQITAQLSHPHILPLLDSGEAAGFFYYVIPYVKGESVRERLARERMLPLDDAVRIAREVAEALDYAHGMGVLHRDIKPDNILLQSGHAVVADFGIARALTVAGGGERPAKAEGTPAYMSPEQAAGDPLADGRSDVYSLACVLFEMLVGHSPYTGRTAQEMITQHTLDAVPTVRAARRAVPEALERTLMKALAKHQVDRFASAAQFGQALDVSAASRPRRFRLAALLGGALLIAAAVWGVWRWKAAAAAQRQAAASVAVLPFVNMSGDSSQESFSDGMTEQLIDALVQVEGLRIAARASIMAYKGKTADIRKIGRELGVWAVVDGSVRRAGDRLRITAQLIKASDGYHLWSHTYEKELSGAADVFQIQDDISRSIVAALPAKLALSTGDTLVKRQTENLEAYDLYLKGRYYWNRRAGQNALKAIEHFEAAIAKDSGYARAYSGLADIYLFAGNDRTIPIGEAHAKAKAAALRAVVLDPRLAEAHTSLGRVRYNVDWDWAGTESEYQRAISLDPKYAYAHSLYGYYLANVRREYAAAIREAELAWQLDSFAQVHAQHLGLIYLHAGRDDDAVRILRKGIALQPDYPQLHRYLADVYFHQGRFDSAHAAYDRALQLQPNFLHALAGRAAVYERTGKHAEALEVLRHLESRTPSAPMARSLLLAQMGRLDEAAAAFEKATESSQTMAPSQFHNPLFDPIRTHPRYVARLKHLGVAP